MRPAPRHFPKPASGPGSSPRLPEGLDDLAVAHALRNRAELLKEQGIQAVLQAGDDHAEAPPDATPSFFLADRSSPAPPPALHTFTHCKRNAPQCVRAPVHLWSHKQLRADRHRDERIKRNQMHGVCCPHEILIVQVTLRTVRVPIQAITDCQNAPGSNGAPLTASAKRQVEHGRGFHLNCEKSLISP